MPVTPYLMFEGRCEEAIEFYKSAVGAEVQMLMRNSESPTPPAPGVLPSGTDHKILHATIRINDSLLHASDGHCQGNPTFQGFTLSYTIDDASKAEKAFAALSNGGQVQMPLSPTFFSPSFGMLTDRFGVSWMVYVPRPMPS